jgi:hypothetical protein
MLDEFGAASWLYEHRVGVYLAFTFLLSMKMSKHSSPNAEKAAQLEDRHLDALTEHNEDAEFTRKQKLAYFHAKQTALINDNLAGLGLTIAFFGGLFAVHFIM